MSRALVAAIALALVPCGALAAKAPPPPTLKDLKRDAPEIRAGETVEGEAPNWKLVAPVTPRPAGRPPGLE